MKRTTSLLATVLRIQSWTACSLIELPFAANGCGPRTRAARVLICLPEEVGKACAKSIFRGRGRQRKCVQHATHASLQGLVDHLVLLHARLADEFPGHNV